MFLGLGFEVSCKVVQCLCSSYTITKTKKVNFPEGYRWMIGAYSLATPNPPIYDSQRAQYASRHTKDIHINTVP